MRDHNRATNREPVLVLPKFWFLRHPCTTGVLNSGKVISRIELVIPEKFPNIAVELVGSRLNGGVHDSRARTPELSAEVRSLDFKFLNCIYRGQNNKIRAVQEIYGVRIVIDAVKHVIILRRAKAVRGKGARSSVTARVSLRRVNPFGQLCEECKISPV